MAPESQLEWEARVGRPAAAVAFLSALLPFLAIAIAPRSDELDDAPAANYLIALDDQPDLALAASVVQRIALPLLVVVFWYLWRCIKARRPEFPRVALVVAVIGPLLLATGAILNTVDRLDTAESFVAELPDSKEERQGQADELNDRADDELDDATDAVRGFTSAGSLALAISFVMFGLWAIRSGLMSRFMGALGIVIGAFYGLAVLAPTGAPELVQLFWVVAVGFLFLGRWPGGRGPAWETGEAEPWPSAMEQQRQAAERLEAEKAATSDGQGDLEAASVDPDTPQATHPRSKKRKRKRRR